MLAQLLIGLTLFVGVIFHFFSLSEVFREVTAIETASFFATRAAFTASSVTQAAESKLRDFYGVDRFSDSHSGFHTKIETDKKHKHTLNIELVKKFSSTTSIKSILERLPSFTKRLPNHKAELFVTTYEKPY